MPGLFFTGEYVVLDARYTFVRWVFMLCGVFPNCVSPLFSIDAGKALAGSISRSQAGMIGDVAFFRPSILEEKLHFRSQASIP